MHATISFLRAHFQLFPSNPRQPDPPHQQRSPHHRPISQHIDYRPEDSKITYKDMMSHDFLTSIHIRKFILRSLNAQVFAQRVPSVSHHPLQQPLLRYHLSHMCIMLVVSLQAFLPVSFLVVAEYVPASKVMRIKCPTE